MGVTKKRGASTAKADRNKASKTETPLVSFATARAWTTWLAAHHALSKGVWLKIAKKGSGRPSVSYAEALEVAITWGWIDGQKGKFDETWWLQKFTPRGPRSVWSKVNRENAMALIASGKMKPAGLAEVDRAKRDGRWEAAYESQRRATVPPDLAAALAANSRAAEFFEKLDSRNRYAVLFRVHAAKKPETRVMRIAKFVEMLARREKLHP
jgi:uncharacterized protein YdeI (YjbR/CyaY-like superfamily)